MMFSLLAAFACIAPASISAGRNFEYQTLDYDYAIDEDVNGPRSLVMMIPDGTGPNIFALARTVLDPTLKTRLLIDQLLMGQVQTHSSTPYVTDSASSATAYSTGFKTYDKAIGVDHFQQPLGTILEAAKKRGMVTGMIVTARVTHATPAAFASHLIERDDEATIAKQYVANKNLDFLLGGGGKFFTEAQFTELKEAGYSVVKNFAELMDYQAKNEASGKLRVFGIFNSGHMSYEVDRVREQQAAGQGKTDREPSLPEMVESILAILKKNPTAKKNGFFMIIEGSRVDHAGHSNDPGTMAKEAITFDETVGVVKDFVSNNKNVGIVSAADHGTGGITLGRDGIYDWHPKALQAQKMSTEWMMGKLSPVLKACTDAMTCKNQLYDTSLEMLKTYTNVTSVTETETATLVKEIATAVDKSKDLNNVMIELGHVISKPANIGWTTVGHVGTDVDLHCMGPSVLERMCKGLHENTYINKIMTNYLNLGHRQDAEYPASPQLHDARVLARISPPLRDDASTVCSSARAPFRNIYEVLAPRLFAKIAYTLIECHFTVTSWIFWTPLVEITMDKKRPRSDADDGDAAASTKQPPTSSTVTGGASISADAAVEVVVVEPFHGGSHKQLIELLVTELLEPHNVRHAVCALPPRKWHWRLMAASLYFASAIPRSDTLRVLLVTSMVNLAELLGLRPDLSSPRVRKILYFHENQLTYPFQLATKNDSKQQRKVAAEDFQIGWAQIVSCVAADELLFNSDFNRLSFLDKVDAFINKIPEPEMRSRGLADQLRAKSRVLYFPLTIPPPALPLVEKDDKLLTVLWNHRWEYDKNPDEFFQTLLELEATGARFQVIVLGEAFNQSPPVFETARKTLEALPNVTIVHWGYAESKAQYFELLRTADVVISTSLHEFYGVAVLEAVICGCYPLVPNRLVYPEFFNSANVFNTQRQLFKKLKSFCGNPRAARKFFDEHGHEFEKFTWPKLRGDYENLLLRGGREPRQIPVAMTE